MIWQGKSGLQSRYELLNLKNTYRQYTRIYNICADKDDMMEVKVTEFRKNLKKYAEMVKKQDLVIVSNGRPIMKITDPEKNKTLRMKQLRGVARTDNDPEDILKGKLSEL